MQGQLIFKRIPSVYCGENTLTVLVRSYLIGFHASKSQHVIRKHWLLKRLIPVLRANVAISHRWFCCRADIATVFLSENHF